MFKAVPAIDKCLDQAINDLLWFVTILRGSPCDEKHKTHIRGNFQGLDIEGVARTIEFVNSILPERLRGVPRIPIILLIEANSAEVLVGQKTLRVAEELARNLGFFP